MKSPTTDDSTEETALLKSLSLNKDQELVLKRFLVKKKAEYMALETQIKQFSRTTEYIQALKEELLEASTKSGPGAFASMEITSRIDRLKDELQSVLNFMKLLDLKDAPESKDIMQYFKVRLMKEAKVKKPFPGRYQGLMAGDLPHGSGILTSTTASIARTKPASPGFTETWNCQFYLGTPIGRVVGRDSLDNTVEFIQLEGKHQGYEIAKYADGMTAHLCVDMNQSGVCVQTVPQNTVPPIKPYGHIRSGIRLVIYKKEQSANTMSKCAFGNIQLEEIEDGKVMKTWKYIQDSSSHLLGTIPRPNLDARKATFHDHMTANLVRELAREEVMQRERQSKKPG